ncbi:MAG: hypothetical protein Q8P90_04950 [bacterium]|nr:hypothetical protein [bacterium]
MNPSIINNLVTLAVALTSIQPLDTTAPQPQAQPPEDSIVIEYETEEMSATLYAYSSTASQTNGNPFVTASGETVTDGIIANNCLAFGTEVMFPEIYGDKIFRVQDRMATRYGCNSFDVWFSNTADAIQFGKKYTTAEVIQ